MSTSVEISLDIAKLPVVATGVSELMGAIDMDASASSVLGEPKLAGDGSDTQIQSEPAATAAATAKVPAVGAAVSDESAPLAAGAATGKGNVLRLRGGAAPDAPDGSRSDMAISLEYRNYYSHLGSVSASRSTEGLSSNFTVFGGWTCSSLRPYKTKAHCLVCLSLSSKISSCLLSMRPCLSSFCFKCFSS